MTALLELTIQRATKLTTAKSDVGEVACKILDGTMQRNLREAHEWVHHAVKILRSAPDAHWDSDEAAARHILTELYAKYPGLKSRKSVT